MSGSVDDMPCMNFEANIFAKSLCQHCFRLSLCHGLGPLALKIQQPFHPLGAERLLYSMDWLHAQECYRSLGNHLTKSPASPNPILICLLALF
uniref:Uncharacterized protein n=1 Tax=Cyanistes caeruleus TaxID=156563 RepID=A0A8C0ZA98_CYACU